MKILAISSYGGLGGGELAFATFLAHRPHDLEVEVLLVSDGPIRERIESLGVTTFAASGCVGRPNPRMVWNYHRQFAALLKEGKYDAVWAVGQKAAVLSAPACRLRRIPLVWHKIDLSWDRLLARPLAVAASGVITVSEAVASTLGVARRLRPLTVVGPPVALSRSPSPDAGRPPAIGTLARLVPYKGHHLIIEAGAILRDEFPDLRVLLAGEAAPQYPDYPDRLHALTRDLDMEGAVEMPGFVEPIEALERLTVFVNATYRDEDGFGFEGLSGAMLEASAAGLPVVATIGGGTAEGVVEGETGTLVAEPSPAAIASALRPYLASPDLTANTGAAGKRFAESRFSPEVLAARLWAALIDQAARASS